MARFWVLLPLLLDANVITDIVCVVTGCYTGPCAPRCTSCDGAAISECKSCISTADLTPAGCMCRIGFYEQENQCGNCHNTCETCVGDREDMCQSCKSGLKLVGSRCECPSGKYWTPNGECYLCHESCKECYGPSKYQCRDCNAFASVHNSRCVCVSGYFPNPHSGTCATCHQSCYTCYGAQADQCNECRPNALLANGMCMCKAGFYHSRETECLSCDHTCRSCSGPKNDQCLTCRPGAINWLGVCSCAQGYSLSPDHLCKPCLSTCHADTYSLQCSHPSQKLTKRMELPTATQRTVAEVLCRVENEHGKTIPSLGDTFALDALDFSNEFGRAVILLLHCRSKEVLGSGLDLIHQGLDVSFQAWVVVFTQPKREEGGDYSPPRSSTMSLENWAMVEDLVYPFPVERTMVVTGTDGTHVQVVEITRAAESILGPKRRLLESVYLYLSNKPILIQFS